MLLYPICPVLFIKVISFFLVKSKKKVGNVSIKLLFKLRNKFNSEIGFITVKGYFTVAALGKICGHVFGTIIATRMLGKRRNQEAKLSIQAEMAHLVNYFYK